MKIRSPKRWVWARQLTQVFFFLLFLLLLLLPAGPGTAFLKGFYFFINPFLGLGLVLMTRHLDPLFLLGLLPWLFTLFWGRFFCGWICPMGAVQQFFAHVWRKKNQKGSPPLRLLRLKYILLVGTLAAAFWGLPALGWLDPFAILTRSTDGVVRPAIRHITLAPLAEGRIPESLSQTGSSLRSWSLDHILGNSPHYQAQGILMGILLLLFILGNRWIPRFFCNALCPLGALYGLTARLGLQRWKTGPACHSCGVCSRSCTFRGGPDERFLPPDCRVCFNCAQSCPVAGVEVHWRTLRSAQAKTPPCQPRSVGERPGLSRRQFLGSVAGGVALSALPAAVGLPSFKQKDYLRPPGALRESDFLDHCLRCGLCAHVCPTNVIQMDVGSSGLAGLCTPVVNPRYGYCEYNCRKCLEVCPSHALKPLSLSEKQAFKIGTAVVDRSRCYTYADGYDCGVCEEHCPVPDKAIRFREVMVNNHRGELVKVRQIYVRPDLCIGCGICQNVCPRTDHPAIVVGPEEEDRTWLMP